MCDCPTAGVFTTHETHRSWIIFQECKTEHGNYLLSIAIFFLKFSMLSTEFCFLHNAVTNSLALKKYLFLMLHENCNSSQKTFVSLFVCFTFFYVLLWELFYYLSKITLVLFVFF